MGVVRFIMLWFFLVNIIDEGMPSNFVLFTPVDNSEFCGFRVSCSCLTS
jgi:hypothetical protein